MIFVFKLKKQSIKVKGKNNQKLTDVTMDVNSNMDFPDKIGAS